MYKSKFFEDIQCGTVFYEEGNPDKFFLRTGKEDAVAIDLETGCLYYLADFNEEEPLYHTVYAEVKIK